MIHLRSIELYCSSHNGTMVTFAVGGKFVVRHSLSLLVVSFLMLALMVTLPVSGSEEYVYYVVVPARIYQYDPVGDQGWGIVNWSEGWEIDYNSFALSAFLAIVALHDDTNVEVYALNDNDLVSEVRLDAMRTHFTLLPNGTVFKIVSDHLVAAMLLGKGGEINQSDGEGPIPCTFYTSTDGNYVGKEFVLVACQSVGGESYRILALENAEVTVSSEDGTQRSYSLQANAYEDVMFVPFKSHKIESTGNIMIQSGDPESRRSFFVPSVQGGFLGTDFYSKSINDWDMTEDYGFRVAALEGATVSVWDLVTLNELELLEVEEGGVVALKPKAAQIMMKSDKPVALSFVHNGSLESNRNWGYGAGVTYFSVEPNEEIMFFLPTNSSVEAYLFAYETTEVTIDGMSRTIEADSYFLLTFPGAHRITSDKDLIVQVIHVPLNPPYQGIENFGVAIPCIQTVNLPTEVTLTPLEEAFPTMYVVMGVGVAVCALLVGFVLIKRR